MLILKDHALSFSFKKTIINSVIIQTFKKQLAMFSSTG